MLLHLNRPHNIHLLDKYVMMARVKFILLDRNSRRCRDQLGTKLQFRHNSNQACKWCIEKQLIEEMKHRTFLLGTSMAGMKQLGSRSLVDKELGIKLKEGNSS